MKKRKSRVALLPSIGLTLLILIASYFLNRQPALPRLPPPPPAPISFSQGHPQDFDAAKRVLKRLFTEGQDFYCACAYDLESRRVVDSASCGFKSSSSRGRRIEWEHVVPASAFGRHFEAWTAGDSSCAKDGRNQRGRACARQSSALFRRMEADLYNLQAAVGELNRARANFAFGDVPGEPRAFGACDFEVVHGTVEPPPAVRGDIARIYFYMDARYPGFGILDAEHQTLFEKWAREDPMDAAERQRVESIEQVQGNSFYIGRLSRASAQGPASQATF